MSRTMKWTLILAVAVAARTAPATPPSGFSGTTIALGRFGEMVVRLFSEDLSPRLMAPASARFEREVDQSLWLSFQRTRGDSDLYVQNNVWAPGGTTGWHTHPGHSLIIVTAGTVTAYEGDDPSCTPHVYKAGMGFVDGGGEHVHVIRNEGPVEARTVAVQLVPAGATRRIDAAANAACGF